MRLHVLSCLLLTVVACGDDGDRNVSAPQNAVVQSGARKGLAGGVPANPAGQGGRPVDGSGTPGRLAMWTGPSTLGDAPIRIDANGDVVLMPGASLFVISADGTRCFQVGGESIVNHKVSGCPKTWP